MQKNLLLVLLIGIGYASVVHADACGDVLANDELIESLGEEFSKSDAELNKVHNSLRKRLKPEAKKMLKKSQLAWIAYRDKDCDFRAASVEGGQAYQPTYVACQLEKTAHRIKELKASGW